MRVVYLDAALVNEQGHFAVVCRSILNALRAGGVDVRAFGHQALEGSLSAELGVQPLFRFHPHAAPSQDPLCGWLVNFHQTAAGMAEDLSRLQGLTADDLVVYDCAKPAQILGLVNWLQASFAPGQCPGVLVILGWPTGTTVQERDADGNPLRWHVHDGQSMLYRFACMQIQPGFKPAIRFAAPCATLAQAYGSLMGVPVETHPAYQRATTSCRNRKDAAAPCIAFLGEQRVDKGYPLVPEIARRLLASGVPLRILVQNSWTQMEEQNAVVRAMASQDARIKFQIGTVDAASWSALLEESDLIVLPYELSTYSTATSGVGQEAIANAIPQAAPANTGLSALMREYGMPGVVFERAEIEQVTQAVLDALANFEKVATAASLAAQAWKTRNSPDNLVQAILRRS